jgi:hypothetical protein
MHIAVFRAAIQARRIFVKAIDSKNILDALLSLELRSFSPFIEI